MRPKETEGGRMYTSIGRFGEIGTLKRIKFQSPNSYTLTDDTNVLYFEHLGEIGS